MVSDAPMARSSPSDIWTTAIPYHTTIRSVPWVFIDYTGVGRCTSCYGLRGFATTCRAGGRRGGSSTTSSTRSPTATTSTLHSRQRCDSTTQTSSKIDVLSFLYCGIHVLLAVFYLLSLVIHVFLIVLSQCTLLFVYFH